MRILIAEDDKVTRRILENVVVKWGYEPIVTEDGNQAWETLIAEDAPKLAILDWMMPGMDGVELARKVRNTPAICTTYIIMLTSLSQKEDIITGLKAGADDYVTKPFDNKELQARINVGIRIVELEQHLKDRIEELEDALAHIKRLQGLVPICAYCKKIRSDDNYWQQVEAYISERSEAEFSHSICPDCYEEFIVPELEELKRKMNLRKCEKAV